MSIFKNASNLLLSLGKKKEMTNIDLLRADNQVVVFDLPNHESLIAATFYKLMVEETGRKVTLSDIRDPLPIGDVYIWISLGDRNDLFNFFGSKIQICEIRKIFNKSFFIPWQNPIHETAKLPEVAAYSASVLHKWQIAATLYKQLPEQTDAFDHDEIVGYYKLIKAAYRAYSMNTVTGEEILAINRGATEAEVGAFNEELQAINKVLSRKTLEMNFLRQAFIHTTVLDESVYMLLRRLWMARKKFVHYSAGVYGTVTFTNDPVALRGFDQKNLITSA